MSITPVTFDGYKAVQIETSKVKLIAVYEFGPRIAFFGKADGENLLLWAPGKYCRKAWDLRGGHRVWVTRPGADECEETYAPDNELAEVEEHENGFTITGAEDAFNCTRRGISVKLLAENKLEVDSFVTNTGDMLFSGGVWALTCTVPGKQTRYGIPAGDGSSWDMFRVVMFRAWGGHAGGCNDDQFYFSDDMMLIEPKGRENKRMLQSPKGIIAMDDPEQGITFAKRTGYEKDGHYPLGCNTAVYVGPDNFMVEMETMGIERTLKQGESAHNTEMWVLASPETGLDNAATLEGLF